MARKRKESEAARLLKEIVCGCPCTPRGFPCPHWRNTSDLVAMDYKQSEQFEGMCSKEFTSLGLVLAGVWSDQIDLQLLATQKFRIVLFDELCPAEPPFILEYGVVPRFEEFLEREDSPALQAEAALALIDICSTALFYTEISIDPVKILLKLLDSPSSDVLEKAVLRLGRVAATRKGRDLVHQHEALRPLLDKVLHPLLDELEKNDELLPKLRNATHTLLRFCTGKERPEWSPDPLKESCPTEPPFILEYGVVPRFDEFLEREDAPAHQTEAALALIDICDIAWIFDKLWIDLDLVKYLLKLLDYPSSDIREKVVLHLGEVAETRKGRDLVHQHEAVCPLLDELDKNDKLLPKLRKATHTLLRFCKGEERPDEFKEEMRTIIPELFRLVDLTDEEVLKDACSMLACFIDGRYCKNQVIISDDVCRRLVELLEHEFPSVVSPAMRTLGNIVLRKDIQSQHIVDFGALPCLWKFLSKNFEEMVVWETIRSLTKGNNRWIKAAPIECTNSQFQDSEWHEIEEIKKEVQENLYKYEDGKLLIFCSQLNIPFCGITARKKDAVPKLMDFLGGLHATTAELHAEEEEQSSKGKKRRRESEQDKDANEEEPEEDTANGVSERSAEKMSELSLSDDEL